MKNTKTIIHFVYFEEDIPKRNPSAGAEGAFSY